MSNFTVNDHRVELICFTTHFAIHFIESGSSPRENIQRPVKRTCKLLPCAERCLSLWRVQKLLDPSNKHLNRIRSERDGANSNVNPEANDLQLYTTILLSIIIGTGDVIPED